MDVVLVVTQPGEELLPITLRALQSYRAFADTRPRGFGCLGGGIWQSERKKKTIGAKRMVGTPSVADVRNIQVGMKLLLTNDKKISPCSPGCVDMRDFVS